ncbi:S-layer homology domain-containing protein [Paenibacillus glycinis]|uniref:SLH domain-containing protein n=1 Tax=Paenibacillus glycinis TaxID=2697035 RepID=A0ABW9XSM8_9BACL|nr:S-layer homology domain-containing protein [Paenibacillus glycinis]NBD25667.1 hypothetical protein [Paenibacillus glycinis]
MKKVLAAMLALLFVLAPVSGYAAASFALEMSADKLQRGEQLTLSGTAEGDVNVKIVRPDKTTFYLDVIESANGKFTKTVTIPEEADFAPYGVYHLAASNGTTTLKKTFAVTDEDGNYPPEPIEGGGIIFVPPANGIPADAGTPTGSDIQPDKASNGTYIVGGDTFTSASGEAGDAVTINLPASSGSTGNALEFPAQVLQTLKSKNKDLVINSDNGTIRIPAEAIAVGNAGQETNIRIVLNTTLTDDAKNAIAGSIGSNADYHGVGAVITVTIQLVSGGTATDIHDLGKPVTVKLKLSNEQAKLIAADLAGVYYVNGSQLEYVGGKMESGTFTFQANHFSTYAILEYSKSFVDMKGHWAEQAVKTLAAKHIVTGVDEQHYVPGRSITRSEFATMLMRTVAWNGKADQPAGANPFNDVPAGQYYADAVTQAASLGIVTGYQGAFRPNDGITREEAVVALVRAAKYFDLSSPGKGTPAFADAKIISAWAAAAVNEAWTKGLIEGDGKQFNPKKSVTRAEVAVMIGRLLPAGSL